MNGARRDRAGTFLCRLVAGALIAAPVMPRAVLAQAVGLGAVRDLEVQELEFTPMKPDLYELDRGVRVLYIENRTLPLVSVFARFKAGPSNFPRGRLGAARGLPSLMRNAGTTSLSPDSVDKMLEFYAVQTTFGGGGQSTFTSLNTLTRHLAEALGIWTDMVRNPGFDSARVEVWRGQELEDLRRRADTPGRLAISQFNHLMYGDHPVGWEMEPEDLTPEAIETMIGLLEESKAEAVAVSFLFSFFKLGFMTFFQEKIVKIRLSSDCTFLLCYPIIIIPRIIIFKKF